MTTSWSGERTAFPAATRRAILQRDPVCRCAGCPDCVNGCNRPSTEADHITPHAEGGPDTEANGQGLCGQCHRHKTAAEQKRGLARWRSTHRIPPQPHPGYMENA